MKESQSHNHKTAFQEGIHFQKHNPKPGFMRILLINIHEDAKRKQVKKALSSIWKRLLELQTGVVRHYDEDDNPIEEGSYAIDTTGLKLLLGFGVKLFTRPWMHTGNLPLPLPLRLTDLQQSGQDRNPFRAMSWKKKKYASRADADFILQLTANTKLSVEQAAISVQEQIRKRDLPLTIRFSTTGFPREDGRSWIGFFDGIKNIERKYREVAIQAEKTNVPGWTYMTFLKIAVDLKAWNELSVEAQELIVGRRKKTGKPIVVVLDQDGDPIPVDAAVPPLAADLTCPFKKSPDLARIDARDTDGENPLTLTVHRRRANLNQRRPDHKDAKRLFRQGYEFSEWCNRKKSLSVGLNFVSFQKLAKLFDFIMQDEVWQGGANFGGCEQKLPCKEVLSLLAGGYFIVPPTGELSFPGADLFHSQN